MALFWYAGPYIKLCFSETNVQNWKTNAHNVENEETKQTRTTRTTSKQTRTTSQTRTTHNILKLGSLKTKEHVPLNICHERFGTVHLQLVGSVYEKDWIVFCGQHLWDFGYFGKYLKYPKYAKCTKIHQYQNVQNSRDNLGPIWERNIFKKGRKLWIGTLWIVKKNNLLWNKCGPLVQIVFRDFSKFWQ